MGCYLARRFVQMGIEDFFCVPGDYNLVLLDQFLKEKKLRMINCCNELNAGYAADGYARAKGVAVLCVTFTVGGLSAINAVAGAYSDNLPVIVISGCPNSNDFSTERVVHHTIGLPQFNQVSSCFRKVTCHSAIIKSVENAAQKIDDCLEKAIALKKPVYIEIACNLPAVDHYSFKPPLCLLSAAVEQSNPEMLEKCVLEICRVLDTAVKPVLVAGSKMRRHVNSGSVEAFLTLADASGYAYACMPDAKGLIDENRPSFIGTYWGQVSDPFCCEAVESADRYVFVGPNFNGKLQRMKRERERDLSIDLSMQRTKGSSSLPIHIRLYHGWVLDLDF
jgi:pyruvate decarboxylase